MFYSPYQIAEKYPDMACGKAKTPARAVLFKAALAGAFVALAVLGAHVTGVLIEGGAAKLIASLLFPGGLAMVLLAGGELFTGNCMLPLGVFSGKISWRDVLVNWGLVYLGNFIGAAIIAALTVLARPDDPAFWSVALHAAEAKAGLTWMAAFSRAILCNILVCVAVWMSYSSESATGKIAAMYFPVALFVLCGTEHCVANAYYFGVAMMHGGAEGVTLGSVIWNNLIPVTLGNIIGGAVFVSGALWFALFKR